MFGEQASLSQVWQARPDDSEQGWGGWCVQPAGELPPSQGGRTLVSTLTQGLAEHISKAHNKLLYSRSYV